MTRLVAAAEAKNIQLDWRIGVQAHKKNHPLFIRGLPTLIL